MTLAGVNNGPAHDTKIRALILAAGRGSRLGNAAEERPKCLLEVGRRSLIDHQIDALADAGIGPVTMVVGYAAAEIKEAVGIRAEYVTNHRWDRTNSMYSFWLAREQLVGPTVILNSDVLFDPKILERLLEIEGDAFAIDSSSGHAREQMKVEIVEGRLSDMRKDLPQDQVCGENVGILKLTYETVQELLAEAQALVDAGEEKSWLGSAVRSLAQTRHLSAVDVKDLPWVEIDFPNDLERARKEVWPRMDPKRKQPSRLRPRAAAVAGIALLSVIPFAIKQSMPGPGALNWDSLRPVGALSEVTLGEGLESWWELAPDASARLTVQGPTQVQLDTRLVDPEPLGGHYVFEVKLDGERHGWYAESTTPSRTWSQDDWVIGRRMRELLEVPSGVHQLEVSIALPEGASVLLRARRQELESED